MRASTTLPAVARRVRVVLRLAAPGLLAGLSVAAVGAPSAIAAIQQVTVVNSAFISATVAVKPGDTVTWTYADSGNFHNVHFNDQGYTFPATPSAGPWTATRTFTAAGEYRYRCDLHGPFGMTGVVYVNASGAIPTFAPYASFTVLPDVATTGQAVTFNAAASSDSDGTIVRHEWDFDGDGSFEADAGAQATVTRSFATSGTRTVGLQVTDSQGFTSATTRPVVVTNAPTPSLTVSPGVAHVGQVVSFDGSASSDPDGTIARYEWDLDGNGSYETDTSATATTSRTYASLGTRTIALRVSDNLGARSVTTRTLEIGEPPAPAPPPALEIQPVVAPPPPLPPAGCEALTGAARTSCMQKRCSTLAGAKRAGCISRSCVHVTGARRANCVRASCRYLARNKRTACSRASCRHLTTARRKACNMRYARQSSRAR